MKALRQSLIALLAAAFGFSLGKMGNDARITSPQDRPAALIRDASSSSSEPAENALSAALSALLERGNFRELARLGTLLAALDSAQMHALLDKLARFPGKEYDEILPRLLAYWTKRDPQAATDWMRPRLASYAKDRRFAYGSHSDGELVRAWAENAPELAMEYACKISGASLSQTILGAAIFAWPDKDYGHRFELLRSYPAGKERQNVVVSFCFTWAQIDRAAALAGASSLPSGSERDGALSEILARWAGSEPAAAFAKAEAFGLHDPALLAIMAKEAAKSDPAAAARWIETQDDALRAGMGSVVAAFWARRDPVAAFEWARDHGLSLTDTADRLSRKMRSDIFAGHASEMRDESPLAAALQESPDKTIAWIRALPAGAERDRFLEMAIYRAGDVERTPPLLAELPPEAAARGAARVAFGLAHRDAASAQQWAESLTGASRKAAWAAIGSARTEPLPLAPGPDRDAMLRGMADANGAWRPMLALERVMEISDPSLRHRTFDDVLWQVNRGEIDFGGGSSGGATPESQKRAVEQWLIDAQIPVEWKKPWQH